LESFVCLLIAVINIIIIIIIFFFVVVVVVVVVPADAACRSQVVVRSSPPLTDDAACMLHLTIDSQQQQQQQQQLLQPPGLTACLLAQTDVVTQHMRGRFYSAPVSSNTALFVALVTRHLVLYTLCLEKWPMKTTQRNTSLQSRNDKHLNL